MGADGEQGKDPKIDGGFFLASRCLFESKVWEDLPATYSKVWIYLFGKACHRNGGQPGLLRGQCRVTYAELQKVLSYKVGIRREQPSRPQIARILRWLRNAGMIVTEKDFTGPRRKHPRELPQEAMKAPLGLVISIVKYGTYQAPGNYEGNTQKDHEGNTLVTDNVQEVQRTCARTDADASSEPSCPSELKGLYLYDSVDQYRNNGTLSSRGKGIFNLWREWPRFLPAQQLAYPGLDILAQVRLAHAWEVGHKEQRKVNRIKYLGIWFSNAQDGRGGAKGRTKGQPRADRRIM